MSIIDFTAEKKKRYTAEKKTDPAALLPILQEWKETDTEKYFTLVAIICDSAAIHPEDLKRHSRKHRPTEKITTIDRYFPYQQIEPENLLPIFRQWKAQDPEKFCTMTAIICSSANIDAEDLAQER